MIVYLTRRNSDNCEGRGPMVHDKCFKTRKAAETYIDSQPGIMGRTAKWSVQRFGDWDIVELEVLDKYDSLDIAMEKKRKALSKLTDEEKSLLGL